MNLLVSPVLKVSSCVALSRFFPRHHADRSEALLQFGVWMLFTVEVPFKHTLLVVVAELVVVPLPPAEVVIIEVMLVVVTVPLPAKDVVVVPFPPKPEVVDEIPLLVVVVI